MKNSPINGIKFFISDNNVFALEWENKIKKFIRDKKFDVKITNNNPQVIIALGGDGTIMKAAKECVKSKAILMGLNLGKVGFLASVRDSKNFFSSLDKIFSGNYGITERIMADVSVVRKEKVIFTATAVNEAVVINPLGMVEVDVFVEDYHLQQIKGTGVMVATPTGSTAFNLSAHGPVVMPDIKGFILSELFDHNIPTPAIILNENQSMAFKIVSFRKRNLIVKKETKEAIDLMLVVDGDMICTLQENDIVKVSKSPDIIRFIELEKNYFLKSLQEKFDFK
jgi:NAD+ kinase